jgi:hypothetical protein
LPAVLGGVVGALVLVGLLGILFVIHGRRNRAKKRFTFHKDLMVQQLPNPPEEQQDSQAFKIMPAITRDLEAGTVSNPSLPSSVSSPSYVVSSPKGPRPKRHPGATYNPSNSSSSSSLLLLNERQRQLSDRIAQLRGQIHEMQRQGGKAHILEEMQREMAWLEDQKMSTWAMGMTDALPSGYARYMAT